MNLDYIKKVLDSGMPAELKRRSILSIISKDENAIPEILEILNHERARKKELILEMNMQLSRADMTRKAPTLNDDDFVTKEIKKFYEENKEQVRHCFKN
jgi:hypothetical protein